MGSEPSPASPPTPEARYPAPSAPSAPSAQLDPVKSPTAQPHVILLLGRWLQANTLVPSWLPARWRHPAVGYLLVVVLQVLAAVITRLLIGFFSTYSFPGALELLVVVLMALSWGAGPSLFATLMGVLLEELVVLPMHVGQVGATTGDVVEVALFLAIGISISLVASASERARRRAVQERADAQEGELAAMRQVQERMDAFLAVASHDLRTPVTATLGFIEIATRRSEQLAAAANEALEEKADLVRQIDGIRRQIKGIRASTSEAYHSAERLSRLVGLLFDTSLARSGELKLQPALCDLAALVRELVEGLRVSTPDRSIRVRLPAPEPVWVMADADRIGQVMMNYLTNALKYSPSDQPVEVWLTTRDGWARVAVEDRGPGLPPSELERVWQRFYRVTHGARVAGTSAQSVASGAETRQSGASTGVVRSSGSSNGLGVGLHISKTIVELHGGKVGVESVVGHGSTFWFALPLIEPTADGSTV